MVGGHVVGAWVGHTVAERQGLPRLGQLPLAIVMVVLTTLTLWSLGQNLVFTDEETPVAARPGAESAAQIETMASRPDQRAVSSVVSTVRMTA